MFALNAAEAEDTKHAMRALQMQKILQTCDRKAVKCLSKSFKLMAANRQTEGDKLHLFLTKDSILENFRKVFTVANESLALRLYNLLAEGVNLRRVYLPQYLAKLLPLASGSLVDKAFFVFRLLDGENQGRLQARDIADVMSNLLQCPVVDEVRKCACPLFAEVHAIYSAFVKQNLLTHRVKKLELDFAFFMAAVPLSCLVNELRDKLLMLHLRPSLFSHDEKDLEKLQRVHAQDLDDAERELSRLRKRNIVAECRLAASRTQQFEAALLSVVLTPAPQGEAETHTNE